MTKKQRKEGKEKLHGKKNTISIKVPFEIIQDSTNKNKKIKIKEREMTNLPKAIRLY